MLQYSDSVPVAQIDTELKEAQDELAKLVKSKQDYQEQLEKQNSEFINLNILNNNLIKNYYSTYAAASSIWPISWTLSMAKPTMLMGRHRQMTLTLSNRLATF